MAPARALLVLSGILIALLVRAPAAGAQDDPAYLPLADSQEHVALLPGDPADPVPLVVTLYGKPAGKGPFPLALVLHEATGNPAVLPRLRMTPLTAYFLSRGYAVAEPMLRGFSGSGGAPFADGCNLAGSARANARDIAAIIAKLRTTYGIDPQRVVIAGLGFGGWNALAAAQLAPPGLRAVVSWFPAMESNLCPADQSRAALIAGTRDLGKNTSLPTFWIYGAPRTGQPPVPQPAMLAAWRGAGARAETLDIGNFMGSAVNILDYPEGLHLWVPRLDAFLGGLGLPGTELSNRYLPVEPPKATGTVDPAAKLPWGDDPTGRAFAAFLKMPFPRVFTIGPGDAGNGTWGGYDPLRTSLARCTVEGKFCMPYAYDNDVVWPVAPGKPVPSHYAEIGDVGRVPYIGDAGRDDYRRFLTFPLPRAYIVSPDGWTMMQGPYAAASALALCRSRFKECETYAVDTTVVWHPPE
jgi:dienelactone hydrolase